MKVELKEIIDQLSEAINLPEGFKVSALIDDKHNNKIVGWTVVKVYEDGTIKPINNNYNRLKDLITMYK
jgi:hypothetical protein